VLGLSRAGEIAFSLGSRESGSFSQSGTLARATLAGGSAPREVLEDIQWADWSPDGRMLAVVRNVGTKNRLEYPIGKTLLETDGWIGHPRISPKGDRVAFLDHPSRRDNGGSVAVVDLAGKKTTLSSLFASSGGLAWAPDGGEVWFTAAPVGANQALYAASLSAKIRVLARVTGSLTLQDVSAGGRALVTHDNFRIGIVLQLADENRQRDLSWLDWGNPRDVSPDGKMVLFEEGGEGGGAGYSVYVRNLDGSPAVRLGEGLAQAFLPGAKSVLAIAHPVTDTRVVVYPLGAGESITVPTPGLNVDAAMAHPDGLRVLLQAREPGRGTRLYLKDLAGGNARAFTPEGYRALGSKALSPDGRVVMAVGPDRKVYLYPLGGGEPVSPPGLKEDDSVTAWSADSRAVFVTRRGERPLKISRVDLGSGTREVVRELMPADSAGVTAVGPVHILPDGKSFVFGYSRTLSDLHVVDGLK
jgi:Tol biopolymer transport system component